MSDGLAQRIRSFREARGLSLELIADRLGVTFEWADDLERYDDEVASTLTVRQLLALAGILGVDSAALLSSDTDAHESGPAVRLQELAASIRARSASLPEGIDQLETEAGWGCREMLGDPRCVGDWCVEQLLQVCEAAGVPWARVLPALEGDLR